MSPAQARATFASREAFWVYQWLLHTGSNLSASELATRPRLGESEVLEA